MFAVHRILTPTEAEGILEREEADAVTLVRALIADPEWVNKARDGARRRDPCVHGLQPRLLRKPHAGLSDHLCDQPERRARGDARQRHADAPPRRASGSSSSAAGPAGLEAAWVAAARGHDVTLLERSAELGGKIRLAAMLPGRAELSAFADWRAGECARRGVDVRLGVDADAATVLALAPDAVIVATGGRASVDTPSKSHPMPIAGSEQPWVIDHERALLEADSLGKQVVILDAIGHIEAIGVGHYLAERGHQVTVVTPMHSPLLLDAETMQKALPRAVAGRRAVACRTPRSWRSATTR